MTPKRQTRPQRGWGNFLLGSYTNSATAMLGTGLSAAAAFVLSPLFLKICFVCASKMALRMYFPPIAIVFGAITVVKSIQTIYAGFANGHKFKGWMGLAGVAGGLAAMYFGYEAWAGLNTMSAADFTGIPEIDNFRLAAHKLVYDLGVAFPELKGNIALMDSFKSYEEQAQAIAECYGDPSLKEKILLKIAEKSEYGGLNIPLETAGGQKIAVVVMMAEMKENMSPLEFYERIRLQFHETFHAVDYLRGITEQKGTWEEYKRAREIFADVAALTYADANGIIPHDKAQELLNLKMLSLFRAYKDEHATFAELWHAFHNTAPSIWGMSLEDAINNAKNYGLTAFLDARASETENLTRLYRDFLTIFSPEAREITKEPDYWTGWYNWFWSIKDDSPADVVALGPAAYATKDEITVLVAKYDYLVPYSKEYLESQGHFSGEDIRHGTGPSYDDPLGNARAAEAAAKAATDPEERKFLESVARYWHEEARRPSITVDEALEKVRDAQQRNAPLPR